MKDINDINFHMVSESIYNGKKEFLLIVRERDNPKEAELITIECAFCDEKLRIFLIE